MDSNKEYHDFNSDFELHGTALYNACFLVATVQLKQPNSFLQ